MTSSIFITGTNTGVGKTITASLILAAAHNAQRNVNYFKPIQTGDESDCALIGELTDIDHTYIKNPVYSLKLAASPYQAALNEQIAINPFNILKKWCTISSTPTIVEGAGGLLVPICKNVLTRDLIKMMNLRIVIVANTLIGTLNHILLTIEAAQILKIPILGIILFKSNNYPWLIETINDFTSVPILAQIPWQISLQKKHLFQIAQDIFNHSHFDLFFGKK